MSLFKTYQPFTANVIVVAVLALTAIPPVFAQKHGGGGGSAKPAAAAKPASSGSAAKAPASGASAGRTGTTTAKGPTTSGRGGATTTTAAGRGVTTNSAAGRGVTTSSPAGRGATTTTTAAGRGAAGTTAAGRAGTAATPAAGRGATAASSHPLPNGARTVQTRSGNEVRTRAGGKPSDVHVANRGMDIHHGLSGNRRVAVERADHSRVVAERGGRGYVQRPYGFRGHDFGRRTYYAHGRAYDRFYRRYPYRGLYFDVYAPEMYYSPAFYGWAYNPWVAPISYSWGWGAAPWYGYYGFYFTPYTVYPSASVWLTDYMISNSLAAAYDARASAAAPGATPAATRTPPPAGATALTPQVKDQIAAEVQRQIALENSEARSTAQNVDPDPASSGIQRMLGDNVQHVFVAGRELDVVDTAGNECAISDGDALQLTAPPPADATSATLTVLSTKGGVECKAGANVAVALTDLQDMQNHMRELIDQGMADLQTKQGKGGLPPLPTSAIAAPAKAPFVAAAPPSDPNVATEIQEQAQAADTAERQALSELPGASGPSGAAAAPQVAAASGAAVGQSTAAVVAAFGQPLSVVNLGPKTIYVYKDQKITFVAGKVTGIAQIQ